MLTKEIELCGKKVMMAYCYATEIAYKAMADEDMHDFIQKAIECINEKKDPDSKRVIFAILASVNSYYESLTDINERKSPVTDHDLMYNLTPKEMGAALGNILILRSQFYQLPKGEEGDTQKEEGESKNA